MREMSACKKKLLLLALLPVLLFNTVFADTYYWVGATSNDWGNNTNWRGLNLITLIYFTPASPPGLNDVVYIGTESNLVITNQPVIYNNHTCASIVFGNVGTSAVSAGITALTKTLTVRDGATLTVTGSIIQNHNFLADNLRTILTGQNATGTGPGSTGKIICSSFQVGTNVLPFSTANTVIAILSCQVPFIEITGNLTLMAVGRNSLSKSLNYAAFDLDAGTMTLNGRFVNQMVNSYDLTTVGFPNYAGSAKFAADNLASNTTLILNNAAPIATPLPANTYVDFSNNGTGTGITNYASGNQVVYTTSTTGLGVNNANYDNLVFSGGGTKTANGGTLTIANNFDNSANTSADFISNSTNVVFYTNVPNIPVNTNLIDGGTNGTTFARLSVTINSPGNPTIPATSGTVTIKNNVNISPNGTFTVDRGCTLNATTNASDIFTLRSDANSSATIMPIPAGCSITGNVRVERFIKGSPADLNKRGYRLISLPVFTGSVGGVRMQAYNYLLNSVYLSGLAGGGFNAPTGNNPSLYLYREDLSPTGTTFTSGNYKGIGKINNANLYDIGTQRRFTTGNVNDTTVNVPAGNGTLFFFRGDKTNNATQTGTKTTAPFDFPEDVVLTATGTLNQGTVDFRHWFSRPNMAQLSFTNSATIDNGTPPRNVRGYNLVGNPYASAIDWNKLNRASTAANSSVYAPGIDNAVWFFNPTNKQYEVYLRPTGNPANDTVLTGTNGTLYTGTGSASNIIASGQGFFVRANAAGGILRFLESAKTTTQPAAGSLNRLMGVPVSTVEGSDPYLRIALKKDDVNDDEILIRFQQNSHEGYDAKEDAEDMGGNGALVALSSFSQEKNLKLAINALPLPANTGSVSLAADATTSGLYSLDRKELAGIPEIYEVWLRDHALKDSIDFRQNSTYTFRIDKLNPVTFGDGRFELVFRKKALPPYELLSFTAEKVKEGVLLKWKTLNEFTYAGFRLERSDNDNGFIEISAMQSDGSGTYTWLDKRGTGEKAAYRILQNMPDGRESYSPVAVLMNTAKKLFTFYPNPAQNGLSIELPDDGTGYFVKISDMQGRNILSRVISGGNGNTDISHLKAGTYVVELRNRQSLAVKVRQKIIKL